MLTHEMKVEILDYHLPANSFNKGLLEDDGLVSIAMEEEKLTYFEITNYINWMREVVLSALQEEANHPPRRPDGPYSSG